MPRLISKKKAAQLIKDKKATYKGEGSLYEAKEAVRLLTEKIGSDVSGSSKDILAACDTIMQSMEAYHKTTLVKMKGTSAKFDMSEINAINDRLITIMQMLTQKPKVWDFDIQRDWQGKMESVIAKEVTH